MRYLKIYLLPNNINPIYRPWLPKVAHVLEIIIIFPGWMSEQDDQSVSREAGFNGMRAYIQKSIGSQSHSLSLSEAL